MCIPPTNYLSLKITFTQFVKTSVIVTGESYLEDYSHPDVHTK